MMKFEHFALNVPDSRAMARWYVEHCAMQVARAGDAPHYAHFLADDSGRMTLEIYSNPKAPYPDYATRHPLVFHWAFAVEDALATARRLQEAGAVFVEEVTPPDGSRLMMLRDPWGVPLQLCQRAQPFD